ncbi:MAG TPA: carbohydrate kinase family protein [Feifaniaceae bacterium]|nr:carbohydrate kinase family protein [Feifaniaceae bacterium]
MKKGICVAGNMIVDHIYPIDGYPKAGELAVMLEGISKSTGGALCNVVFDLARLDPKLPLTALGMVGADEDGELILSLLKEFPNIDHSRIQREGKTSFTIVVNDTLTTQRTFFTYYGASALFDETRIDWDSLDCDLLHIGYIMLLNALDQEDAEYGTKMARLLHSAKQRGIKTSIDIVSETSDRPKRLVPPALKYTDYCIINELEAGAATGIPLRAEDGHLQKENLEAALTKLKELGVSTWAVIHCPEGGYGLDEANAYCEVDGLRLPEGYIKGTVGAGDAFCSGVLYGAYRGYALKEAIELGTAAAACSLSEADSTGGLRPAEEAMALYRRLR